VWIGISQYFLAFVLVCPQEKPKGDKPSINQSIIIMNHKKDVVLVVKSLALAVFSPLVVVGLIVGETLALTKKRLLVPPRAVHPIQPLSSRAPPQQGQRRHQPGQLLPY
jgi:hypothetical protein